MAPLEWTPLLLRLVSKGEVNSVDLCQVRGWFRQNQCPPEDAEDGRWADEPALSPPQAQIKPLLEGLTGQLLRLRAGGNSRLKMVLGIDLTANLGRRFAYSHALIRRAFLSVLCLFPLPLSAFSSFVRPQQTVKDNVSVLQRQQIQIGY